jgi:uncharacterized protein DUF6340
MSRLRYVCALVVIVAAARAAGASRIVFERTVSAHVGLGGAQDLLLTYAIGDNDKISTFVDTLVEQANRSGSLRVIDVTRIEHSQERSHRWRRAPRYVEQRTPADAFLRVEAFTCTAVPRTGQGSTFDVDGNRIRTTFRWTDAVCNAHLDIIAKRTNVKIAEVTVRGEGTSPRVDELTDGERDTALDQAARFAAISAAEEITPRRVRETITLVDDAPEFARGMAQVDTDNFDEARRIWENALTRHRDSAGLEFNLAAVCEALHDLNAANAHYAAAERLAPGERRYRYEYAMFRSRYGLKR